MSSYRQLLYHLVFRTKFSRPTIKEENAPKLYAYIAGIAKSKSCHMYIVNGISNHIHILTDIHPSVSLADYMREVKVSSSVWMKESSLFPSFTGWAEGYGAFTVSYKHMESVKEYIRNQQEHHSSKEFEEEYRNLLKEYGIDPDERYFP